MKNILIIAVAVILAGLIFIYANSKKPEEISTDVAVAVEGKTVGQAAIGGEFNLINQKGEQVNDKQFRGKYMLVFFGFTNCPSICPTELNVMTDALNRLGADAEKFEPIFITVDPERDTPQRMAEFFKNFHPRFTALTGTREEVDKVKDEYKVFSSVVDAPDKKGDYNMDHSSFIYLMDKQGKYLAHFPSGGTAEDLINGLKKIN